MKKYDVQPLQSWGSLPVNLKPKWVSLGCDKRVYKIAISDRDLAECHNSNSSDLPLIAIMTATSSRGVKYPSTKSLSLFTTFLPSLVKTLDCGFQYVYVMGYDVGDAYYDSDAGLNETVKWFEDNVKSVLFKNTIEINLLLVKVDNVLKKPGPVFLKIAKVAYDYGVHYFYRVNDDTELINRWPDIFVNALKSLPLQVGIIGPMCKQGNVAILTHDFVHRTHMQIFEMNYYPPELVDWWMDDWMTTVYGINRTLQSKTVHVIHHESHGKRYDVEKSNYKKLKKLVLAGRRNISAWLSKFNIVEQFDDINFSGFRTF